MTKANRSREIPRPKALAGIAPDEPVHLVINGHKHLLESPLREQTLAVCRPALVLANLDLDTPTHHVAQAGNTINTHPIAQQTDPERGDGVSRQANENPTRTDAGRQAT